MVSTEPMGDAMADGVAVAKHATSAAEDTLKQKSRDPNRAGRRAVRQVCRDAGRLGRGYGEEVRDPVRIAGALNRTCSEVAKPGKSAVVNICDDPSEYAPGIEAQTMYD